MSFPQRHDREKRSKTEGLIPESDKKYLAYIMTRSENV